MNLRWKIAQAAEIRWWQRYLKNKNTSDYATWKKAYWTKLLSEIGLSALLNPNTAAQKILDAGCGPAGIFMVLTPQHQVTALDPLLNDYEKKLAHFKQIFYPDVTFVSKSLESFDAEKQNFDTVFCLNAINHVSASSVGVGARYNLRSNLTAKMDYGWQLQHLPTTGNRHHFLNFAIMTSY